MQPLFFFDLETSGLKPQRHAILQAAWCIENAETGETMFERCMDVAVTHGDLDLQALEINHFTIERIRKGVDPDRFLYILKDDLMSAGFGSPVIPCGHCVQFDLDFLSALCRRRNEYLFSYIDSSAVLDTCALSRWLSHVKALDVTNFKLSSLCEHFGIPIAPHDAGEDVRAVRQLYHKLLRLLKG